MQQVEPFVPFLERLNKSQIPYFVIDGLASILYGEPRLTNDIDLVIDLHIEDAAKMERIFEPERFYVPPLEVLQAEIRNPKGHFNIIDNETGYKADFYFVGNDRFEKFALARRKSMEFEGIIVWVGPSECIILKKLEFYKEGGSDKHVRDVRNMLLISKELIDMDLLTGMVCDYGLTREWREVQKTLK
jgi:hypothetical protein